MKMNFYDWWYLNFRIWYWTNVFEGRLPHFPEYENLKWQ